MPSTASVALRVEDNMSATLTKIRSAMSPFRRDINELQREMDRLDDTKVTLKVDMEKAKRELNEARKAFRDLEDETNRTRLEKAHEAYETLAGQLREVNKAAKQTVKDMEDVTGAISKADNRASSATGGRGGSGMLSQLATAGLFNQLGQSVSQAGSGYISSALGSEAGGMVNSILSGAVSGAAMGSIGGIGIGTAIGAGVGAISGAISGGAQAFQNRDEYFKAYYNEILDNAAAERARGIQEGSSVAGGRERKQLAFSTLLGSEALAESYLGQVKRMAAETNYTYDDITGYAKSLITPFGAEKSLDILTKLSDTSAALSLSGNDTQVLINGLSRMKMTGKTTQEYLNYFSERGIDVYGALSRWGSAAEVSDKVRKGEINGGEAAEAILAYMEQEFGGLSKDMAGTFQGLTDNLADAKANLDERYGIGYNEGRKGGLQAEMDSYEGELGSAMGELNQLSGALAAYRENLQEQYLREAREALMLGKETTLYDAGDQADLTRMAEEYRAAREAAAAGDMDAARKMESLKISADALARNAYDSSEWAKKELSAEEENTNAVRALTAAFDGWTFKYNAEQQKTKGGADGAYPFIVPTGSGGISGDTSSEVSGSHATGLRRVPYNGYIAELHQDERILTAQEARQADQKAIGGHVFNISIYGDFSGRSGEDMETIAQMMADQILLKIEAGINQ